MAAAEVVTAVMEYCWLQQNAPVELHRDSDDSASDSLVDAMLGRVAVVMSSTSKSNEAFHSPARDCARVMSLGESVRIGAVTMVCIVVDLNGTVQTFWRTSLTGRVRIVPGHRQFLLAEMREHPGRSAQQHGHVRHGSNRGLAPTRQMGQQPKQLRQLLYITHGLAPSRQIKTGG
jgi:hypothetical protein